jgi:hypothetical protein
MNMEKREKPNAYLQWTQFRENFETFSLTEVFINQYIVAYINIKGKPGKVKW